LVDRAIELLSTLPESTERDRQELSLQSRLVGAMAILNLSSPKIERAYVRARQLCEQLGDDHELFRTLSGLHATHWARAEHAKAEEVAEEMLRRARATRDRAQLLVANYTVLNSFYNRGEFLLARDHAEEAIGLYDPQDYTAGEYPYTRSDVGIVVLGLAGLVMWELGYPDQALARSQQARALARERSDPYSQANIVGLCPAIHLWRGEYRAGLAETEAGMAFSRKHGLLWNLAVGALFRARALILLGQLDEGIAGLRAVLRAMRRSGNEMGSSGLLTVLAGALGQAGQTDEGLALLAEAQAVIARTGERQSEAELHRTRGNLLLALSTPDPAQAEVAFREALEVARRQSAKSYELRAAMSLALLWQGQGRDEEARDLLQPVYDWFTEGFDTKDLKDAKALLEELA